MAGAKYTTIAEVAKAFQSGELDRSTQSLLLDKGGMQVSLTYTYSDTLSEEENEKKWDESHRLVAIEYAEPLEQALTALGIPWQWA